MQLALVPRRKEDRLLFEYLLREAVDPNVNRLPIPKANEESAAFGRGNGREGRL